MPVGRCGSRRTHVVSTPSAVSARTIRSPAASRPTRLIQAVRIPSLARPTQALLSAPAWSMNSAAAECSDSPGGGASASIVSPSAIRSKEATVRIFELSALFWMPPKNHDFRRLTAEFTVRYLVSSNETRGRTAPGAGAVYRRCGGQGARAAQRLFLSRAAAVAQ